MSEDEVRRIIDDVRKLYDRTETNGMGIVRLEGKLDNITMQLAELVKELSRERAEQRARFWKIGGSLMVPAVIALVVFLLKLYKAIP